MLSDTIQTVIKGRAAKTAHAHNTHTLMSTPLKSLSTSEHAHTHRPTSPFRQVLPSLWGCPQPATPARSSGGSAPSSICRKLAYGTSSTPTPCGHLPTGASGLPVPALLPCPPWHKAVSRTRGPDGTHRFLPPAFSGHQAKARPSFVTTQCHISKSRSLSFSNTTPGGHEGACHAAHSPRWEAGRHTCVP